MMSNLIMIKEKFDNKLIVVNGISHCIRVDVEEHDMDPDISIYINVWGIKRLNFWAKYYVSENRIKILDIQCKKDDRNRGYGSIAMNVLFEIGNMLNVIKYTGFLSDVDLNDPDDPEHKERLVHFYLKHGFTVDLDNRHIEKNVLTDAYNPDLEINSPNEILDFADGITLIKVGLESAELIWKMQVEAFSELYEKYQDTETNPATESIDKVIERISQPFTYYYLIECNKKIVGAIRVVDKKEGKTKRISPIFVLDKYRNLGIAQKTIKAIEAIHGCENWELDTILEERGNCYLYEKLGYCKFGETKKINDRLTLVHYKK